jgi:hypothetical protein
MLKFLFILFTGLLVIPRLLRLLASGSRRGVERPPEPRPSSPPDSLSELTRQDISDADYEELPPEE